MGCIQTKDISEEEEKTESIDHSQISVKLNDNEKEQKGKPWWGKRLWRPWKRNSVHRIQEDMVAVQGDFEEQKDDTKNSKSPNFLLCTDKTQVSEPECPPKKRICLTKENTQPENREGIKTIKIAVKRAYLDSSFAFHDEKDPPKKRIRLQTLETNVAPEVDIKNYLGLPNPGNNCYMNSCLQSLLALEDFVTTNQVLSLVPGAELLRLLNDIKESQSSSSEMKKLRLLLALKNAVSRHNVEFRDNHQKDAHEFLTSVLDQIRSSGPEIQMMAARMDRKYVCPVESNMTFKMQSERICRGCHTGSEKQEFFTNLSLDVVPGCGTVDELLQSYLQATELEYRCACGSDLSSKRELFATLPKVLILHLKRFMYTPQYQLAKVFDPIFINRDLVVTTTNEGACYSLVSIISHFGSSAEGGHYICEGRDPKFNPHDMMDRWFKYNDAQVTETSGASVCRKRQRSAFILFYKRQVDES